MVGEDVGEECVRGRVVGERVEGERERAVRMRAKRVVSVVEARVRGVRGVDGGEEAVEDVLGVGEPRG